jgi:hypothetical protein
MADERSARRSRKEVTTRMPLELHESVVALAARQGLTVNELVCGLCEEAVLAVDDEMVERKAERDRQRAIEILEQAVQLIATAGASRQTQEVAA